MPLEARSTGVTRTMQVPLRVKRRDAPVAA